MQRRTSSDSGRLAVLSFALDEAASVRTVDENGFLHVATSHLTKAAVNPYYGREIPNGVENGYAPDSIYYGFRDPEELRKSIPTWAGLPLHAMHHMDSADDPQKDTRVGAVGTDVVWNDPYVDAPLTVWDGGAIDAIEDGSLRELSCAYRYEPDFTPGEWDGMKYDFVMRDIRGNHVALVEEGRAGPDVLVADHNTITGADMENVIQQTDAVTEAPIKAADAPADVEQQEVDLAQAIIDLHKIDPATGQIVDISEDEAQAAELRGALADSLIGIPPEKLARIANAMHGLKFGPMPMPAPEGVEVAEVSVAPGLPLDEAPAPEGVPAPEKAPTGLGDPTPPEGSVQEVPNQGSADAPAPAGEEAPATAPAPAEGEAQGDQPIPPAPVAPTRDAEFREAMDKCGLDGDNPDLAKAFAEGVMYGERSVAEKESQADSEPAPEPPAEQPAPASDPEPPAQEDCKDEEIGIPAGVVAPDGCPVAQDGKPKSAAPAAVVAQDARAIRDAAVREAKEHMRSLYRAVEAVKPLIGNVDAFAFDSAEDVYAHALSQKGYDPKKTPRSAWRPMVEVMLSERNLATFEAASIGQDSAVRPDDGPDSKILSRINIS